MHMLSKSMASSAMFPCLFLVAALTFVDLSSAGLFKVGDSDGWTSSKNVDYTNWANSIHFNIDDVLKFEYDNKTENVLRLSHHDYSSCNLSDPAHKWTSGNDAVRFHRPGRYFFISSVDGKCDGKAKFNLQVFPHAPSPATPEGPSNPVAAPAPSPKSSSVSAAPASLGFFALTLLQIALFA